LNVFTAYLFSSKTIANFLLYRSLLKYGLHCVRAPRMPGTTLTATDPLRWPHHWQSNDHCCKEQQFKDKPSAVKCQRPQR